MSFSELIVEERGEAQWVTLNRPDALNAITPKMCEELADFFQSKKTDVATRVIVLRGAGRAFCAGLDLKARSQSKQRGASGLERLTDIVRDIRRCPQPVLALIHGPACGGGFAFALAADIRIAGSSARMNDAFIKLGVSGCELGLSYFLPRYVGLSVATELMYTGRFIDAEPAERLGLVSEVVEDAELENAGERMVADLLSVSPTGLRKTKQVVNQTLGIDSLEAVMAFELQTQLECMRGPDHAEAIRAFLEKRTPNFSG